MPLPCMIGWLFMPRMKLDMIIFVRWFRWPTSTVRSKKFPTLPWMRWLAGPERMGWMQANVAMALESEDADEFRAYIRGLDLRD